VICLAAAAWVGLVGAASPGASDPGATVAAEARAEPISAEAPRAAAPRGVLVVGRPTQPGAAISAREVQEIFLGIQRTWPDGTPAVPVILADGTLHAAFLDAWVGKSPQQFRRYWRQMVFAGRGVSPAAFACQEDLLAHLAQTAGSIGYLADSLAARLPADVIIVARGPQEETP